MYDGPRLPASRAAAAAGTPARDLDRTIAHLLMTAQINTAHLDRHTAEAQAATTPDSLAHNLRHARNHVAVVSEHQHKLRDAIAARVPAAGREADRLDHAIDDATRKSGADLDRGLAHDLSSAVIAAGHVDRHLSEAQAGGGPASVAFNLVHAATHVRELTHYHGELRKNLAERLPAVADEIGRLRQVTRPGSALPPPADRSREADYDVTGPDHGPQPA